MRVHRQKARGGSLYEKIMEEVRQSGDSYSHAGRVNTYAALFAIALRTSNAEDVAVAGILHDVGVSLLPPEIQTKPEHGITKEELDLFRTHPQLTLDAAKNRKLLLGDMVIDAIVQHHERFIGGGYPANVEGRRMKAPTQLLALADRFDYLTRLEANLSPLEPEQALRRISAEGIVNSEMILDIPRIFNRKQPSKQSA